MKIISKALHERQIYSGYLLQKARLTLLLAPDAMKQLDASREHLRETFGLTRLEWVRFNDLGMLGGSGPGDLAQPIDHIIGDRESKYEITLLGNADLSEAAEGLLTWISAVARLKESNAPDPKSKVTLMILDDPYTQNSPKPPAGWLRWLIGPIA
jgi:hypothetical protein